MRRWTVQDRDGRTIYLTQERWQHIVDRHNELTDHFEDVLDTIRQGRRRQDPIQPRSYHYYRECEFLPRGFIGIEVVVVFKLKTEGDQIVPNNFVVSAWGIREVI